MPADSPVSTRIPDPVRSAIVAIRSAAGADADHTRTRWADLPRTHDSRMGDVVLIFVSTT